MTQPSRATGNGRRIRGTNGTYVTKLNDDLIDKIAENVRHGAWVETAFAAAGISRSTFYEWFRAVANGEGTPRQKKLVAAVELAEAEADLADERFLFASPDWRARLGRMERRNPAKYGLLQRAQIDGNVQHDHRHTLDLGALSLEQKQQMLELLRAARANDDTIDGEVIDLPAQLPPS